MRRLKSFLMSPFATFCYVSLFVWGGYLFLRYEKVRWQAENKSHLMMALRGRMPVDVGDTAILLVSVPNDEFYEEYKAVLEESAHEWAQANNATVGSTSMSSGIYGIAILIQIRKNPVLLEKIAKRSPPPGSRGLFQHIRAYIDILKY